MNSGMEICENIIDDIIPIWLNYINVIGEILRAPSESVSFNRCKNFGLLSADVSKRNAFLFKKLTLPKMPVLDFFIHRFLSHDDLSMLKSEV